jgi:Rad3-related DNA helicase
MSLKVDIRTPAYSAYLMRSKALVNMSATLSVPGMYPNITKRATTKFPAEELLDLNVPRPT